MLYSKMFLTERSPYLGDSPKCWLFPVISALGSIGSTVLGGILGNKSTNDTNKANAANNERYNQSQIELAKLNNKFNVEQWNRQNEYNTPANQMQRYRDAGINPYMALSQVNSGNAESSVTGTMPNTAAPPNMMPKDYSFVGNSAQIAMQTSLAAANAIKASKEATGQDIQNKFDAAAFADRVSQMHYDSDFKKYSAGLQKNAYDLAGKTFANNVELSGLTVQDAKMEILKKQAETAKINADTEFTKIQGRLSEQQIKQMKYYLDNVAPEELKNLKKLGRLTDQQIKSEIANRALTYAQVRKTQLEADEIDSLMDYKIAGYELDNSIKRTTYNVAEATQGIEIERKRADFAKSGWLPMHRSGKFGISAGKFGTFGVDIGQDYNYNVFDDVGVDKFDASRWRNRQDLPPTKIKRKSFRYNGKYYSRDKL